MDTAKVIMVDLTTFEELSAVIDQLLNFLGELTERDANAATDVSDFGTCARSRRP